MTDDIRNWLEELELGEFARAFIANAVDRASLLEFDDDDLKDIGLARVANRKSILNAMVTMTADAPPAPGAQSGRLDPAVLSCVREM